MAMGDKDTGGKQAGATEKSVAADPWGAHVDQVAMVSRRKDGTPDQGSDFVLLVAEDATDEQKAAAWNKGGEQPDPKHVQRIGRARR